MKCEESLCIDSMQKDRNETNRSGCREGCRVGAVTGEKEDAETCREAMADSEAEADEGGSDRESWETAHPTVFARTLWFLNVSTRLFHCQSSTCVSSSSSRTWECARSIRRIVLEVSSNTKFSTRGSPCR